MTTTDAASVPTAEADSVPPRSSRRDLLLIALVFALILLAIGLVVFGGMPAFGADPMAGT
ncbi:MAG TPA: hypothetical protein VFM06_11570 [Candidatus Limnocylindria bacterium]|nr:hypothetical protein [Candidatus Limnocylindria bacterium]